MTAVPVLDVGGSHVSGAWVDIERWSVMGHRYETQLSPSGSANEIIASIAACAQHLGDLSDSHLGVAIPGPFDYITGVGRFTGIGEFEPVGSVDVGRQLVETLTSKPRSIVFLDDAAAFTLGEWVNGATSGHPRTVGAHPRHRNRLRLRRHRRRRRAAGRLRVSPAARPSTTGGAGQHPSDRPSVRARARGVIDVLHAARQGDNHAAAVLDNAFVFLGVTLAPCLRTFGAGVTVVGGKIADAWPEMAPRIERGLADGGAEVPLVRARHPATAAFAGAESHLSRASAHHPVSTPSCPCDHPVPTASTGGP